MKRWIDALTNVTSLCDTVPPQVAVYAPQVLTEGTIGKTKGLSWQLRGRFKDRMTGIAAGGMQPGPLKALSCRGPATESWMIPSQVTRSIWLEKW